MTGKAVNPHDTVIAELKNAAPFFDAGHVLGSGLSPSQLAMLRYCMMMTSRAPKARTTAIDLACSWLTEARRRWKAGFSADPFPETPVPRRAGWSPA